MVQLAVYLSIIGMTKHNYAFCLSAKLHHEIEAEHQDDKQSCRYIGISVSCLAFPVQNAIKQDFHHLHISCIFKVHNRCRRFFSVFVHHAIGVLSLQSVAFISSSELLLLTESCTGLVGSNW